MGPPPAGERSKSAVANGVATGDGLTVPAPGSPPTVAVGALTPATGPDEPAGELPNGPAPPGMSAGGAVLDGMAPTVLPLGVSARDMVVAVSGGPLAGPTRPALHPVRPAATAPTTARTGTSPRDARGAGAGPRGDGGW